MAYVLRIVQRFRAADERAFLALEAKLAAALYGVLELRA